MKPQKVVIIIPTYNEASVIAETLNTVFSHTGSLNQYDTHVLIFDSASKDATASIVQSMQANHPSLHFVQESEKSGLGSAYYQAMRYALNQLNADIIFEFDADLSHQPKYIPTMLDIIQHHDVVVGSRYTSDSPSPQNWGIYRKYLSILGNWVARIVISDRYTDFTSGLRATRAAMLSNVLHKPFISNQYAYKLELMWLLDKQGADIVELPIKFINREKGVSKLPYNSIWDALKVLFLLKIRQFTPTAS